MYKKILSHIEDNLTNISLEDHRNHTQIVKTNSSISELEGKVEILRGDVRILEEKELEIEVKLRNMRYTKYFVTGFYQKYIEGYTVDDLMEHFVMEYNEVHEVLRELDLEPK